MFHLKVKIIRLTSIASTTIDTNSMTRTIFGTRVDRVGDVESTHTIGCITVEIQVSFSRVCDYLGNALINQTIFDEQTTVCCQEWSKHRITVEDVQVVP